MDWIISDGGPLICMEVSEEPTWGGIDRLTVPCSDANNDYDRACKPNGFAAALPLRRGTALVLCSGPLDTSIWTAPSGALCVVSVVCAEPDIHEPSMLAALNENIFDTPLECTDIAFASSALTIFDSAHPGTETDKRSLTFQIRPGSYRVFSHTFEPNERASFIVHKFASSP